MQNQVRAKESRALIFRLTAKQNAVLIGQRARAHEMTRHAHRVHSVRVVHQEMAHHCVHSVKDVHRETEHLRVPRALRVTGVRQDHRAVVVANRRVVVVRAAIVVRHADVLKSVSSCV